MESKNQVGGGGLGLGGVLFVVFLVLKLVGTIDWSWLWVFAPLWIPLGLALLLFFVGTVLIRLADSNRWKNQCK